MWAISGVAGQQMCLPRLLHEARRSGGASLKMQKIHVTPQRCKADWKKTHQQTHGTNVMQINFRVLWHQRSHADKSTKKNPWCHLEFRFLVPNQLVAWINLFRGKNPAWLTSTMCDSSHICNTQHRQAPIYNLLATLNLAYLNKNIYVQYELLDILALQLILPIMFIIYYW